MCILLLLLSLYLLPLIRCTANAHAKWATRQFVRRCIPRVLNAMHVLENCSLTVDPSCACRCRRVSATSDASVAQHCILVRRRRKCLCDIHHHGCVRQHGSLPRNCLPTASFGRQRHPRSLAVLSIIYCSSRQVRTQQRYCILSELLDQSSLLLILADRVV